MHRFKSFSQPTERSQIKCSIVEHKGLSLLRKSGRNPTPGLFKERRNYSEVKVEGAKLTPNITFITSVQPLVVNFVKYPLMQTSLTARLDRLRERLEVFEGWFAS